MNVKLSRWVFLVLCGLLCIVLVVPARSATNLVVNGDFSGTPDLVGWTQEVGSGVGTLSDAQSVGDVALTPQEQTPISYAQCVNLSAPSVSIDVGGSVWFPGWEDGNIVVEIYDASGCGGSVLEVITLRPAEDPGWGCDWADLSELSHVLPSGKRPG